MLLSRYPTAPARSAANRSSSSSDTVNITTAVEDATCEMAAAASIPPPGMRTSMSATCGRIERTAATAVGASGASPLTSKPPCSSADRTRARVGR